NKAVMEALDGLPPVKVHCSVLAEQAVKAAISDYYSRLGIDPAPIVGAVLKDVHQQDGCGGSCGEGCSCGQ
ncbi:MAG: iron-sulfur cluster assembly scaffold protein, partial [Oscillospiraceae bacterium]